MLYTLARNLTARILEDKTPENWGYGLSLEDPKLDQLLSELYGLGLLSIGIALFTQGNIRKRTRDDDPPQQLILRLDPCHRPILIIETHESSDLSEQSVLVNGSGLENIIYAILRSGVFFYDVNEESAQKGLD